MLRIDQLRLHPGQRETLLCARCAKLLRVAPADITACTVLRKAIDAREDLTLVYTVSVSVKNEAQVLRRCRDKRVSVYKQEVYFLPPPVTAPAVRPIVVGAGPAGLFAALVLARCGARVTAYDENDRPGGQLFKQIHKFFGSGHHGAGVRGVELGRQLLAECEAAGVEICLSHAVYGIFPGGRLGVTHAGYGRIIRAEKILIATGATEKALAFPGWDLPGVMGAGAAQTMVNLNRVLPGRRIIMVGSGNVGLVVGFQLLQAGAHLAAVVEARSQISGYAVHANKLMRAGVPILTGHTVLEARGRDSVEEVTIGRVDERYRPIPGTERTIETDTVCLAVGLTPSIELLRMANVGLTHLPPMGGYLPLYSGTLCTTNPDIYVAGDVAGIEEASTAMEEGRLAGTAIAAALGLLEEAEAGRQMEEIRRRAAQLRTGPHGEARGAAKAELERRYVQWQNS